MKLDLLTLHCEDIAEVVGDFHGTPINLYYPQEAEARNQAYLYALTHRSMEERAKRDASYNG